MTVSRPSEAFWEWRGGGLLHSHRGHAVFYRLGGAGPPLLLIHGFPSASWDFEPMWRALTQRFRVVAADMMGFGWSDKPLDYHYSMFDQADLFEGLCEALGIDRAHVLAHDYGDTVAQELLARTAERTATQRDGLRISSACLLNGGVFPELHRPRPVQRLLASRVGRFVGPLMRKAAFGRSLRAIFGKDTPPSRQLVEELWTLLRHEDGQCIVHELIGYMRERRENRDRWVGALTETSVPVRFVNGMVDPVSGAHMVRRYRELCPSPDVVELPSIGHYPQIEDTGAVLEAFSAFHHRLRTF